MVSGRSWSVAVVPVRGRGVVVSTGTSWDADVPARARGVLVSARSRVSAVPARGGVIPARLSMPVPVGPINRVMKRALTHKINPMA